MSKTVASILRLLLLDWNGFRHLEMLIFTTSSSPIEVIITKETMIKLGN